MSVTRPGGPLQQRTIESFTNIVKTADGWRLSYCLDGVKLRVVDFESIADAIDYMSRVNANHRRTI